MRFLMLNWRDPRNPSSGGAERITEGFLAALVERGHTVFWFAHEFPGSAPEELIAGIRVVRGGGIGSSVLEAWKWFRAQPRFDLVIDQHHGIPWYAPWWSRTNCIALVHEVLGPIWDAFYRPPWNHLGRLQERWTHWWYRDVPFWAPSESTRKDLQRHGVRRVMVIRNGLATRAIPELDAKPIGQPLQLAAVCRLAPNKRVSHCLQALAVLQRRGINAQLKVVGGGEMEPLLREEAARLDLSRRVVFTGVIAEPAKDAVLRESHLLLHTSMREGWGLNVIEANALGTPAVVYPVAGLVDSTQHDQTGLVAARETPEALADQIQAFLVDDDRYQRCRRAAWKRADSLHWSRVLPKACEWLEARARGEPLGPEA
jgi:glycosyltransferase involved in cell wall biosynthesis